MPQLSTRDSAKDCNAESSVDNLQSLFKCKDLDR